MKEVVIIRFKVTDNYSLGRAFLIHEDGQGEELGVCLERGWQDNKRRVSCVPAGDYLLQLEYSNRFEQDLWELKGVPNRSECKIHVANYWRQLNGCLSFGKEHVDIDRDGDLDVTSSRDTIDKFHEKMQGETSARIRIINL